MVNIPRSKKDTKYLTCGPPRNKTSIKRALIFLATLSTLPFFFFDPSNQTPADLADGEPQQHMHCPKEPAGYSGTRQGISPGSPVLFLIPHDPKYPSFRDFWRNDLFPLMPDLNMDAVFLVEKSQMSDISAAEIKEYGDIAFYDVPHYKEPLAGFYYRAMAGWLYGLNQKKQYEWFIRPDMDAFYCLHHIRLELNALDAKERPETKPGIHWSHFYGDGSGGQPGPPVSDVQEIFNRVAAEEALKYAKEAMHDGIWDLEAVEVYGSNVADLSPKVMQVHDVRWAYGPGVNGKTFWNSGFLGFDYGATECLCANWLSIHLGKANLETRFEALKSYAAKSQEKIIDFDQDIPAGALIGSSPPYFRVGGCKGKKKSWPGCGSPSNNG